jgi:hypothetical protein
MAGKLKPFCTQLEKDEEHPETAKSPREAREIGRNMGAKR